MAQQAAEDLVLSVVYLCMCQLPGQKLAVPRKGEKEIHTIHSASNINGKMLITSCPTCTLQETGLMDML